MTNKELIPSPSLAMIAETPMIYPTDQIPSTTDVITQLTTGALDEESAYRSGIWLLTHAPSTLDNNPDVWAAINPGYGGGWKFDFQQAVTILRHGTEPISLDDRNMLLIACSLAHGTPVCLKLVSSLPEKYRHVVVYAVALMFGLSVTIDSDT